MNERKLMTIKLVLQGVLASGVIAAAFTAFYAAKSVEVHKDAILAQQTLSRSQFAAQLVGGFLDAVQPCADTVKMYTTYHIPPGQSSLNENEAYRILSAKPGGKEHKLRGCVVELLDYMKYVCTAYKLEAADSTYARKMFCGEFCKWYKTFGKSFVDVGIRDYEAYAWIVIDEVMPGWCSECELEYLRSK